MERGSLRVQRSAAPVRAQVLLKLRGAIMDRTFEPGQRLLERELCEMTGVSRTSVREALRQLEAEGLVEMVPNQGPIVATISASEAQELYEVRAVIEGLAGRFFAARATEAQIERLAEAVDSIEEVVAAGEQHRLLELKDLFYDILLEGAGNATAAHMLGGLHARITLLRATTLGQAGRPVRTVAELRGILDKVRAREPEEAERLCIDHVRRAGAIAVLALQTAQGKDEGKSFDEQLNPTMEPQ